MHHLGHALLSLPGVSALAAAFSHGNHYDAIFIAGGASGTYTAVRLQGEGKRVALIEREDHLGGQVNTYIDPSTQQPFDHGVLVYENISVVRTFFDSVKAPYKSAGPFLPGMKDVYVDLASNKAVPASQAATISGNATEQTAIYIELLKKFPYLSEAGYHLPDPVPEELLISFGDWLEKYNITGLASGLFNFDYGGNVHDQPALYMLRYHNLVTVETPLPGGSGYLRQADLNNQALYDAAYRHLGGGENIFFNADVRSIVRDNRGVEVRLNTQGTNGRLEVLRADQLIMAIPPLVDQLDKLRDLTHNEHQLFRQFNYSYVWDAVALSSGINMIAPKHP